VYHIRNLTVKRTLAPSLHLTNSTIITPSLRTELTIHFGPYRVIYGMYVGSRAIQLCKPTLLMTKGATHEKRHIEKLTSGVSNKKAMCAHVSLYVGTGMSTTKHREWMCPYVAVRFLQFKGRNCYALAPVPAHPRTSWHPPCFSGLPAEAVTINGKSY
jgi:hypothetical protein